MRALGGSWAEFRSGMDGRVSRQFRHFLGAWGGHRSHTLRGGGRDLEWHPGLEHQSLHAF